MAGGQTTTPHYGRYVEDAEGRRVLRYTAIDPGREAFACTCGRPACTRARLLPFRDHIVELHRTLVQSAYDDLCLDDDGDSSWNAVLYPLQIAASIQDVFADTGYVEDPLGFALCETAADYENAQSEMASKYVAGLSIFSFLWAAYEAAVAMTAPTQYPSLLKGRLGERGRKLFETDPILATTFDGLADLCRLAEYHCTRGGRMQTRLERILSKYPERNFVFAAELAREFRNFVYHGEDGVPHHEHWGDTDGAWESRSRLRRFYSVGRLLLLMIQALAIRALAESGHVHQESMDDDGEPIENPVAKLRIVQFGH